MDTNITFGRKTTNLFLYSIAHDRRSLKGETLCRFICLSHRGKQNTHPSIRVDWRMLPTASEQTPHYYGKIRFHKSGVEDFCPSVTAIPLPSTSPTVYVKPSFGNSEDGTIPAWFWILKNPLNKTV